MSQRVQTLHQVPNLYIINSDLQKADEAINNNDNKNVKKLLRWNKFTSFRLLVLTAADVYLTFPRQEMIWQIVPAFALDVGVLNWGMAAAAADGERGKFARLASLLSLS